VSPSARICTRTNCRNASDAFPEACRVRVRLILMRHVARGLKPE
jgi:hypothetical protein